MSIEFHLPQLPFWAPLRLNTDSFGLHFSLHGLPGTSRLHRSKLAFEQSVHSLHNGPVLGVSNHVVVLQAVFGVIVEFRCAVITFRKPPPVDSNCTSVAPSTEGRRLTLSIRILDERQKALPIEFLGCGKAGIVTKSREKVYQLNESFRLRAGRSRRVARDEWDPHDLLVDAVLAPLPAPSEVIPVITSENYERILELSFGSQVIEQPSDLSIEERNCRVITALSFALLSLGHFDRRLPKH